MIWHDVEQNSEEWMELRRGKFTASTFSDLLMGKSTAGYEKAIYKVAYEILTDESPEFYSSDYMKRGHEMEPWAVERYEMLNFVDTTNGGFFEHSQYIGASPDRCIGSDGLLQIKSPAFNTMINYLRKREIPKDYMAQMQGELFVSGREWIDFFAFHPMLPELITRVYPIKETQDQLKSELEIAIESALKIVDEIRAMKDYTHKT